MQCKRLAIFFDAINNEIDIDVDLIKRLGRADLTFTPLRGLKTLKYIEQYNISSLTYTLLAILFTVLSPLYFIVKMFQFLPKVGGNITIGSDFEEDLILVANGRVEYLYNKVNNIQTGLLLNVNQFDSNKRHSFYQFLSARDCFSAYFYSVISVILFLFNGNKRHHVLQLYVAYEWFLVYAALSKNKDKFNKVYFANHYDRWAVMFDRIFENSNLVLLQHGILPESLDLRYKLKNLNCIFTLDNASVDIFQRMFFCPNTQFKRLDITLPLAHIKNIKQTVLIIGQPNCIQEEIEIAQRIRDNFDVFVKPHPLYDNTEYRKLKNVIVVTDNKFYPKVNIALCYESTLGVEYEASGIPVLWWKGMSCSDVELQLNSIIKEE